MEVGTEVIGPQAPASPFFIYAARQRQSGPAATGGNVALQREHERAMHSPEPPCEIFEGRLLPAPITHGCSDLHVRARQRMVLEKAEKLTADAVSERHYRQSTRPFRRRGERSAHVEQSPVAHAGGFGSEIARRGQSHAAIVVNERVVTPF